MIRPIKETLQEQLDRLNAGRDPKVRPYTFYWLAAQLGVSDGHLWSLCNQAKSIRIQTGGMLDKLCKVLNCTPGDLLQYIPD